MANNEEPLSRKAYRNQQRDQQIKQRQRDQKRVEVEKAFARDHEDNTKPEEKIVRNPHAQPVKRLKRRLNIAISIVILLIIVVYLILFLV